tara:strand:- start:1417 stop:1809 length:393 start_codon:yes stop_codon:yes gene_type:complete
MKKIKTKGTPNEIDVHVGKRLRLRRSALGFSQEKLAALVNLTFQQIQKYERGTNRVSAGRLYELSNILQVEVQYFFDGLDSCDHENINDLSSRAINHADMYDKLDGKSKKLIDEITAFKLSESAQVTCHG